MFDVVNKCLIDGQSPITAATVLNHHWEQVHNDCTGIECKHCIKSTTHTNSIDERRGSADTDLILQPNMKLKQRHESYGNSLSTNEGYFRFFIEGQPVRLMLLAKDRQNLLKIISFDFLVVCMQVQRHNLCVKSGNGHNFK